jgi:hypothetical protein
MDYILKCLSDRNKKGVYKAGMQNDPGALVKLEALYVGTPYLLAYNGRPFDGRPGSRSKKVRMSKKETALKLVDAAVTHFGRIDLLAKNAGIFMPKAFTDCPQNATFVTGENIRVDGGVHAGRQ